MSFSSCPLLVELHEPCFVFPAMICNDTNEVLPAKEAPLRLGVQGFYQGSVMQARSPHITNLGSSVSSTATTPEAGLR